MRVIVAEDALITREGLLSILRGSGVDVVAEVDRAEGLDELVTRLRPDVVIVDIRMPPHFRDEGLVAARRIRATSDVGVVVLSQYLEPGYAMRLLEHAETRVGICSRSVSSTRPCSWTHSGESSKGRRSSTPRSWLGSWVAAGRTILWAH